MAIGKLKRHELRKIWKNEAIDFTTWLETNIDALADAIGFELLEVKREEGVGSFSADLVAVDSSGERVVVENQLERTDHTHLGQIITYVSNLDAKTVVWISSEPRQEHINAVNWLNTHTHLNFYLLKLEAISIDESKPAPLFQTICRPDEQIRNAAASQNELTAREKFNVEFWTEMNKKCASSLRGFSNRKPPKYHFHSQAAGRGGFSFVFLATRKFYGVELYIDAGNADLNESYLNELKQEKQDLESELGLNLRFDDLPEKRACRIRAIIQDNVDVMEADQSKVQTALLDAMVKFEKVFKERIKNLSGDLQYAA